MKDMVTRIKEELERRIEAAGFGAITITMKVNGDHITIKPCGYPTHIKSWAEIDWFLMDSEVLNLCGSSKLEEVARDIANYEELLKEDAEMLESLKAHIREHGEDSDWDFVSDYHKEIFGHRPHVPTAQIIAWAYSKSTVSARYFR